MPQHMEALARANTVRRARAQIKREIHSGDRRICDVVREVPDCMRTITLTELLCSQRRWGATRARKLLNRLPDGGMKEHKQLGTLTERQRNLLADVLQRRNGNWSGLT